MKRFLIFKQKVSLLLLFLVFSSPLLLNSCKEKEESPSINSSSTCLACHSVTLDDNHDLSCTSCHRGNDSGKSAEVAHSGLISQPAHPDNDDQFCGSCHEMQVSGVINNNHYTLSNHIRLVKTALDLEVSPVISDLEGTDYPQNLDELVDDLLLRRCLRCHVYSQGDSFPSTERATGCGACHLDFLNGTLVNHTFSKYPKDSSCLSCHYGNHVGFDYYGRFEHDYNEEYRTPYTTSEEFFRPYGVEYHQLEPDVHKAAGLVCIDCHQKQQLMYDTVQASRGCEDCHYMNSQSTKTIPYRFQSTATERSFTAPVMEHEAHERYKDRVSCQACHAQWAYNDSPTHLVRIDHDDFDELEYLTLDGSSEVLEVLSSHMDYEGEWLPPEMSDKFSSTIRPGIWFKGFGERRWENITLVADSDGILQVGRPLLNLHISWIDENEAVIFDNITTSQDHAWIPYSPHTIGKAGSYYKNRLNTQKLPPPSHK